jgi:hypothetical protein
LTRRSYLEDLPQISEGEQPHIGDEDPLNICSEKVRFIDLPYRLDLFLEMKGLSCHQEEKTLKTPHRKIL